jgi:hypothetical protein
MHPGRLYIRKVRRYRKARYPSRSPYVKPSRSPGASVLRAAAAPAAALALGAGGCLDQGADDTPDATSGIEGGREAGPESGSEVRDDAWFVDTIGMSDAWRLARLTELEGRAVIRAAIAEAALEDTDPCAVPTLSERMREDQSLAILNAEAEPAGSAVIDLFAPQDTIPAGETCPARLRQAVGFEFMTPEEGDDEDVSGRTEGFTRTEREALAARRTLGKEAMAVLDAESFPYATLEYADPSPYRARAEENLRAAVLELIAELRRDGML